MHICIYFKYYNPKRVGGHLMRKREALAGLNHYECQEGGYVMRKFLFEVPTATDLNNGMHVFSHMMMGPGIGHL